MLRARDARNRGEEEWGVGESAPELQVVGGEVELPALDLRGKLDAVCVHLDSLVAWIEMA